MKKVLTIFFISLFLLCGVSHAQFGTHPFGRNPFSGNGAFGRGPFGSASTPTVVTNNLKDDSGNLVQDSSGNQVKG